MAEQNMKFINLWLLATFPSYLLQWEKEFFLMTIPSLWQLPDQSQAMHQMCCESDITIVSQILKDNDFKKVLFKSGVNVGGTDIHIWVDHSIMYVPAWFLYLVLTNTWRWLHMSSQWTLVLPNTCISVYSPYSQMHSHIEAKVASLLEYSWYNLYCYQ